MKQSADEAINSIQEVLSNYENSKETKLAAIDTIVNRYLFYREPERGGLVNPNGGDYPLKWMGKGMVDEDE